MGRLPPNGNAPGGTARSSGRTEAARLGKWATGPAASDPLTLIAISALAYVTAVGLHEHLGHAVACILLGSHPTELGAFYINCDYTGLSDLRIRLEALAGPVVSLVIVVVAFLVLLARPPRGANAYFFVWLLSSLGLMAATGYLSFSGLTGIGDFGTSRDGVFYQASPEWLWRSLLTLIGIGSYLLVVRLALREIDPHFSGQGRPRIRAARPPLNCCLCNTLAQFIA